MRKTALGGLYLEGERTGHVLYITSDGSAGVVAESLDAFLGLIASVPEWHDVLKFSDGGKLGDMQAAAALQRDYLERVHVESGPVEELRALFPVPDPISAVDDLHAAIHELGRNVSVIAREDNTEWPSLFGHFTSKDLREFYEKLAKVSGC